MIQNERQVLHNINFNQYILDKNKVEKHTIMPLLYESFTFSYHIKKHTLIVQLVDSTTTV